MSESERERIFKCLADAIDDAGEERETLLLAEICLLLAEKVDNADEVERLIDAACRSLGGSIST